MNTKEKIKDINKRIEPYYLLIMMLVFFIGGFIAISKFFFSPPDLLVKVTKEEINYPSSINEKYMDIFSFIQDSCKNKETKSQSLDVYNYLLQTKSQRILEFQNNTKNSIKGINIRMTSVKNLTSWAVSSEYLLEQEKDKLMKNIIFQNQSGIVYLKDAVNLPPNGSLKIYLWGDFDPLEWNESLIVDYDGGQAKIENSKTFSGLKAILAEYFYEIMFVVILTFILIYLLQIQKNDTHKKDISESN
jgi:hypothetical protein